MRKQRRFEPRPIRSAKNSKNTIKSMTYFVVILAKLFCHTFRHTFTLAKQLLLYQIPWILTALGELKMIVVGE